MGLPSPSRMVPIPNAYDIQGLSYGLHSMRVALLTYSGGVESHSRILYHVSVNQTVTSSTKITSAGPSTSASANTSAAAPSCSVAPVQI
ncbi:uncharacterized protein LACBIDRAFT_310919 [Laccaria bicolor S238N-H82]|uniref:Predicted protein n=1 Tax=Laccaria bicolor (strain S238N-H82 / ATCC MYA-4686) TaxID=486041 RepID=B0DVE1_LACBS|nr:uncharacterized protein LACBIDRAFT_310919 [Laccaria bicolor S238N-H82]EDR01560.1 predicted protein [Laccaria bicolor S238N-H82]|eukprot:XP_001887912.1 predicted protein [Laccaria bicolor S238N-H82]